jgi:PhnB protein
MILSTTGDTAMHIPPGFAVVTPYIFADGAEAYVRFLEAAFGAREVGRSTAPDGRIANCQLRFDTATVMLSEASQAFPPSRAALYLYVTNAEEAVQRAVQVGAVKIMDVDDMPYGDRQGGVRDPAGNIWWVSQRLSAKPYF